MDSPERLRALPLAAVAERFAELGVDRVLARDVPSDALRRVAVGVRPLPDGYRLFVLPPAPLARSTPGAPGPLRAAMSDRGRRIELTLPPGGRAVLSVAWSRDWRIERGEARLVREDPGFVAVEGAGEVVLAARPRGEEWTGLGAGLMGWAVIGAAAAAGRARRRRSGGPS